MLLDGDDSLFLLVIWCLVGNADRFPHFRTQCLCQTFAQLHDCNDSSWSLLQNHTPINKPINKSINKPINKPIYKVIALLKATAETDEKSLRRETEVDMLSLLRLHPFVHVPFVCCQLYSLSLLLKLFVGLVCVRGVGVRGFGFLPPCWLLALVHIAVVLFSLMHFNRI